MSVDLTIKAKSSADKFATVKLGGQVANWSVSEESTPLDPSDSSGSVGGFTVTFDKRLDPHEVKHWRRRMAYLEDLGQGITVGRIETPSGGTGPTQLTVQSLLTKLAVTRQMMPLNTDLESAISYFMDLCSITSSHWLVDPEIALMEVNLVGFYGDVWTQLKKLCAVANIEITLVSDLIVVRPVRQRIAQTYRDSDIQWAIDDSQAASYVEVNWWELTTVSPTGTTPVFGTRLDYEGAGTGDPLNPGGTG